MWDGRWEVGKWEAIHRTKEEEETRPRCRVRGRKLKGKKGKKGKKEAGKGQVARERNTVRQSRPFEVLPVQV